MFHHHGLRGLAQAGLVSMFELRPDGLYCEADLNQSEAAERCLTLVREGRAAWSSGTMPHLMDVASDGYVRRWPVVEASIVHVDEAGSYPGTTTAFFAPIRSIWIMSEQNVTEDQRIVPPPPAAPLPAEALPSSELIAMRSALDALRLTVEQQSRRVLPAAPAATPVLRVSSHWDSVTALQMLMFDRARRYASARGWVVPARDEEFMRALVDKLAALRAIDQARAAGSLRAIDAAAFDAWHARVPHLRADEAMQSTLANAGDELVPTMLSSVVYHAWRMESRVFGLLPAFDLPSVPYEWPTIGSGPTIRRVLEATDQAQASIPNSPRKFSKPTTNKITFSPGKIGAGVLVSRELFARSGIPLIEALTTEYVRQMAIAADDVLLNGDESTNATNISHYGVDPTGTTYDRYLILDGLRHIAIGNSDSAAAATISANSITAIQKLMGARGRLGLDIANLVCIVDPGVMYKLLDLSDFQTIDKIGDKATFLTGQVGSWKGIPVVVSDELENANDSGQYPSTHDGAKGQFLILHKQGLRIGRERLMEMDSGDVPHTGLFAMSGTESFDLQAFEAGMVAHAFNVTV